LPSALFPVTGQRGIDLDPDPPLRTEPVRREEVRFGVRFERQYLGGWQPHYELWTMPLGTFRNEVRQRGVDWPALAYFVGDPGLWRSLWDEVAANLAADYAEKLRVYQQHPDFVRLWGWPREWWLTRIPELRQAWTRQYVCQHCSRGYIGIQLRGSQRIWVCSNRCERERRIAQQRRWRKNNPPDYRLINAARTARRAEARTDRVCEYCRAPIEAARSTRRFCSDMCRVRAHRAGQTLR
jgi:hypothetical protein